MNYQKINNFETDQNIEHNVSQFLDENFYSVISCNTATFGRATELSDQFAGIDLSVGNILIDEKVKNARTPNKINNWWASIEIYQKTRTGDFVKGWFASPKMKTTHYSYLYNFTDSNNQTSSVIMVLWNKDELKQLIDQQTGFQNIIDDASQMEYAKPKIDDKHYFDALGHKLWKLTKSYEGAVVLTTTLKDLSYLKHTRILKIDKGQKIKTITFQKLQSYFT